MSETDPTFWDAHAAAFDDGPDHGLGDDDTRQAWRELLLTHLPPAPAVVLDLGCGTGTLSVLLAREGYAVCAVDFSGAMVAQAAAKAARAGVEIDVVVGDAARPPYQDASCDVVLCRHVLWALADPAQVLGGWVRLLRPGGRLVLVEGRWSTGSGISAVECERLVRRHRESAEVVHLTDPVFWGGPIGDERYLVVSPR